MQAAVHSLPHQPLLSPYAHRTRQQQQQQHHLHPNLDPTPLLNGHHPTGLPLLQQHHLHSSTTSTSAAMQHQQPTNTASSSLLASPAVPAPRKRKRAHQYTVSYSEVKEVDTEGKLREVIVIDDTPPPPTASPATTRASLKYSTSYQPTALSGPIRTRARAAAEAQALSASTSAGTAVHPPPAKKRKRDEHEAQSAASKRLAPNAAQGYNNASVTNGWPPHRELSRPGSCDEADGHYRIVENDIIHKRYRTVQLLGQGTFGKVVQAVDTQTGKSVAIKIIRAIPKYRDASKIEVRVLSRLKERDPMNKHKCIHLLEWFDHRNHICIVSELFGKCLYDFLKENEFAPFPRQHIQSFAKQLFGSVAFLHELKLIHTDLKPENILLVHNDYKEVAVPSSGKRNSQPHKKRILDSTDIRLIDFGSATFDNEYHSTVVCTRHYRAPEIILGLGWSYPCDAFSLGCILVEFYTGSALYQTHDNLEHLAMMEMVMGEMPERYARAGARSKPEFFKRGGKLAWPQAKSSRQSKKDVKACKPLHEIIPPTDTFNKQFLDLVKKLLAFDPSQRLTVREALNHPYLQLQIPNEL